MIFKKCNNNDNNNNNNKQIDFNTTKPNSIC